MEWVATFSGLRKLSEVLQNYLAKEWPKNSDDWLFFNPRTGDRLKGFRGVWEKVIDAAQIKGMRFYDFRHTYCSYLIQHYPIHVVQKRMGHRQIETTAKYLHHFRDQMQDVGDKLDEILGFSDY